MLSGRCAAHSNGTYVSLGGWGTVKRQDAPLSGKVAPVFSSRVSASTKHKERGRATPPSLNISASFLLDLLPLSRKDAALVYWSMSALLIARQPEEPSGSVMVTATGLRRTAARLTLIASTRSE